MRNVHRQRPHSRRSYYNPICTSPVKYEAAFVPSDRKRRRERKKRMTECVLLFIRFVLFFRFQVGGDGDDSPLRENEVEREAARRFRRLMRSLWHARVSGRRYIAASHAYSKIHRQ